MKRAILALALALAMFALTKRGDDESATKLTYAGVTDQGFRITAFVEQGRVVAFRARVVVDCTRPGWSGPTDVLLTGAAPGVGKRTWRPALEERRIVDRGPAGRHGGSVATDVFSARLAGARLSGTIATSIAIEADGTTLKCVADDVRFSLRA